MSGTRLPRGAGVPFGFVPCTRPRQRTEFLSPDPRLIRDDDPAIEMGADFHRQRLLRYASTLAVRASLAAESR